MHPADSPPSSPRRPSGYRSRRRWVAGLGALAATSAIVLPIAGSASGQTPNEFQQTNLISDIPGVARVTDPDLVNPWGQSASAASPLWFADNGSNVSTFYTGGVNGSIPTKNPTVVSIPGGAPTGTVFNPSSGFVVTTAKGSAPANFIFDSESGVVSAWSGAVSGSAASVEFATKRAVDKGLAIATANGSTFLYAADFGTGHIDVFNDRFQKVAMPGAFRDAQIPKRFAPFNIQSLNGDLYVTYAKQTPNKQNDVAGPGNGFVDVYDTSGHLLTRLISGGDLNSPWGLAIAPANWGGFGGDLLVGNFGDGAIHAYDPNTGAELGQLTNTDGNPIIIDGLWALRFGNGTFGTPNDLVFSAGIADEAHGLVGEITPAG
jgi:uncharacterized protein (TIGR03118 family)